MPIERFQWQDLTDKQRDLCTAAQRQERDDIVGYLRQLGRLTYVEQDPAELLRIIATDVKRGAHKGRTYPDQGTD